jgi:ABC-2 type transport system ATP-binding protein
MADDPAAPGEVLEVRGLHKWFGDAHVLAGVNLSLFSDELAILTGANGAGKSTLLECLAGAQSFDEGRLRLCGRGVVPHTRRYWREVYSILDDFAWFPDLTVGDHFRLLNPEMTRSEYVEHLERLEATALIDRKVATLSSGQRQRCALVSAAIRPWKVLLLDEPERHLDRAGVAALGELLQDWLHRGAILVASHDDRLTSLPGARHLSVEGSGLVESR